MVPILKFSQLSPSRRALIRIIQALNYGSILDLKIVNGELNLDPQAEVLIDVRLDEDVSARPELELEDFTLPAEVLRLLGQIDALQNGTIERIVVHAGVPRRVTLRALLQNHMQEMPSHEELTKQRGEL
jgi:hypothetical protein